jgi:hypothetical protein
VISAFVLALVGILAGPASQATAAQGATLAAASPVATGDFSGPIDIGGRKLYLECRGQGSPTVILEAGAQEPRQEAKSSARRWRWFPARS